jgi:acyl transferase domain-containing protein
VTYVEAHGTGTRLGDGIELTALARALGTGRPADRPLLVGSVKTNIGHLEAAAGIAGLIKTVLALHHGTIPPHLHLREPSRQVDWARLPIRVTDRSQNWPDGPRIAGVSAFGFTGTNAHVVLSEAETTAPAAAAALDGRRPALLALSAAAAPSLRAAADRMRAHLTGADAGAVADACHTAGARRSHLEHRLVVVGRTGAELCAALAAYADGNAPADLAPRVHTGSSTPGEDRPFALVYADDMPDLPWRHWDTTEPAFAAALDAVDAEAGALLGRSARAALYGGVGPVTDPVGILAAQLALTALWRDHGVRPSAVVGHGTGEIAAACAGGLLDERAAVRAVGGLPDVRLTGDPACGVHLDSVAADDSPQALAAWVPTPAGRGGAWRPEVARVLADRGIETLVGVDLDGQAEAGVSALATTGLSVVRAAAGVEDHELMAHCVAELHVRGCPVDFAALLGGRRPVVSLPSYPWQLRRHWIGDDRPPAPAPDPAKPLASPVTAPAPATPEPATDTTPGPAPELPPLAAEARALPPELRLDLVLTRVLAAVAQVLGESSGADVDPDTGFFDLGLDSVMAVALMDELGQLLAVELEPTLTFEQPNCRALAGYLLDLMPAAEDSAPAVATDGTAPERAAAPLAIPGDESDPQTDEDEDDGLAELSDDDLANRLLDRIARSEALLNEVV